MRRRRVSLAALSALVITVVAGQQVSAEKRGGILKLASPASPASMSPMEEATIVAEMPMMGVFNNLIPHPPDEAAILSVSEAISI